MPVWRCDQVGIKNSWFLDLYDSLVAPTLQTDLTVESWRRGGLVWMNSSKFDNYSNFRSPFNVAWPITRMMLWVFMYDSSRSFWATQIYRLETRPSFPTRRTIRKWPDQPIRASPTSALETSTEWPLNTSEEEALCAPTHLHSGALSTWSRLRIHAEYVKSRMITPIVEIRW